VSAETLQQAIDNGQFALPSFAPGGAFPHVQGRFAGPPAGPGEERAAIATLYVAAMTSAVLDLIESRNDVIVDGGLANNAALLGMLAALRPGQRVVRTPVAEGTALGAAALAFEAHGKREIFRPRIEEIAPLHLTGLAAYFAAWKELSAQG
jgi:sugar (pentulose or hexulose) kinase